MSCSSAAFIMSSSCVEPPGLATYLTPNLIYNEDSHPSFMLMPTCFAQSMLSRKGKKASEEITTSVNLLNHSRRSSFKETILETCLITCRAEGLDVVSKIAVPIVLIS